MESRKTPKYTSAEEAMKVIRSGDHVYIHSVAAAPQHLIQAMTKRSDELENVQVYHLHTEGPAPYANKDMGKAFHINALFVGANVRDAVQSDRGSYIPVFLSEMPIMFKEGHIQVNVALISVSPPSAHGYVTLGTSVDTTRAVIRCADIVIAQMNDQMPKTNGDSALHISELDYIIEQSEPLIEVEPTPISDIEMSIGRNVAGLIEDGSTLQMGIGAIPNAVLDSLEFHKNLGIHTEMFSDGVLNLVEKGVINGEMKKNHRGRIVSTFVMGSRKLYDFVNENPMVRLLDCDYVNATNVIRQNPKVIAINSAVEIDLTGQVCADSIGANIYSGVGGQMDFIRGASLSHGGKPIIALSSVTNKGESKITPFLKTGAGVVTTRSHVQYVATEWGVVNLYGKSIEDRCRLLISIAHPNHREELIKQAQIIYKTKV